MKDVVKRSECPISNCLDFVGDKWSLLIIRDIALDGKTTFGEFIESGEGIATNILSSRLKQLEAEGFIAKYPLEGKNRTGYHLTKKGIELVPIIAEMYLWGLKHGGSNTRKKFASALKRDKESAIQELTEELLKNAKVLQKRSKK